MADTNACSFYRCWMPALWLNKTYANVNAYCSYNLFSKGEMPFNYEDYYSHKLLKKAKEDKRERLSAEEFMKEFADIDVVVYQRNYTPAVLTHMKAMKKLGKKVFIESDDWLLGDITAQRIKKIYSDPKMRLIMENILIEADGIIVSTEPLKEMYSKYNNNVYVCPNSIDLSLWKWQDIRSADEMVGFAGSYTHQKDFRDFPIHKINKKYPMLFIGLKPTIDADYLDWIDIGSYQEVLSGAFRVGIAPLYRNDFNQAKCLIGDTLVPTIDGIKKIMDINDTDNVILPDGSTKRVIANCKYNKCKTIIIKTKNGYSLEGTTNHKIMNSDGNWIMLSELKIGDNVIIAPFEIAQKEYQSIKYPLLLTKSIKEDIFDNLHYDMLPRIIVNEKWGLLLGLLFGDGCMHGFNRIAISCSTDYEDVIEIVEKLFMSCGLRPKRKRKYDKRFHELYNNSKGIDVIASSRNARLLFEHVGFIGKNGKIFRVPDVIFRSPKTVIKEFLKGLFEADGTVDSSGVSFCTKDYNFARDVHMLLLGFGIRAKIKQAYNKIYRRNYYFVVLGREATDLFANQIGFLSQKKSDKLKNITNKPHSNAFKNWSWIDEINSIECAINDTYDIEIEDEHKYIANGIVSHNSPIKWFEYSMAGILTIAENYGPYKIINNEVDGYLCDGNWMELLDKAISKPEDTERIVCNAQNRIKREYTIDKHIHKWVDVFRCYQNYNNVVNA